MQKNGNAAGNSVKINDTLLLEIHIIPEYVITKQSGPCVFYADIQIWGQRSVCVEEAPVDDCYLFKT